MSANETDEEQEEAGPCDDDGQDDDGDEEEDGDDDEDDYDDIFDDDYYNEDLDQELFESQSNKDPEYHDYECLNVQDVERLLNESVEAISSYIDLSPSLAKVLLHTHEWNIEKITEKHHRNPSTLLSDSRIKSLDTTMAPATISTELTVSTSSSPSITTSTTTTTSSSSIAPGATSLRSLKSNCIICNICLMPYHQDKYISLNCGHIFCKDCWSSHLEIQVSQGVTMGIQCMAQDCHVLVPEDFALNLLTKTTLREKYQQFAFSDYVKSHPQLRFCPGINCNVVVRAKERQAKRVICKNCKTSFCFKCGAEYHAPTKCDIIKKWLTKCADDSETANYISAHTKDCPKCHICIEKNGGCNHMQCFSCKHDFCWMCLGDWKSHGSEYYECSRYKENPNIANESAHAQAREALKKYLFYYERWENHSRSLRLEEQTLQRIKERTHQKVMSNKGTWIDWQYLIDAAGLLAKCRYTLQYTYPYAYFMEPGPRKLLFEYQQAQLEAEIENLSWKVERAETTDRGDLENQMDVAEKRRTTLLKDFLAN